MQQCVVTEGKKHTHHIQGHWKFKILEAKYETKLQYFLGGDVKTCGEGEGYVLENYNGVKTQIKN